jgi:hypothetical protein
MSIKRNGPTWGLWLAAALLLAGCFGAPAPAQAPLPAAVAGGAELPASPVAGPLTAAPPEEGGLTSGETGAAARVALPSPTRSDPATSPTVAVTVTPMPDPTATLPPATATSTPAFPSRDPHPMQIDIMRQQSYPGSEITLERTLSPGANFKRNATYVDVIARRGYFTTAMQRTVAFFDRCVRGS